MAQTGIQQELHVVASIQRILPDLEILFVIYQLKWFSVLNEIREEYPLVGKSTDSTGAVLSASSVLITKRATDLPSFLLNTNQMMVCSKLSGMYNSGKKTEMTFNTLSKSMLSETNVMISMEDIISEQEQNEICQKAFAAGTRGA